jgi:membrane protease subunit HflK
MYLPLDQIMKNIPKSNTGSASSVDVSAITDQVLNEIRTRQNDRRQETR